MKVGNAWGPLVCVAMTLTGAVGAITARAGTPLVMGAMGDSITRAMDSGLPGDQPRHSWSTGDGARRPVESHYYRLEDAGFDVTAINQARSGGKAVEIPGQARALAAQHPDYVTLLIGANDLCSWTDDHAAALAAFARDVDTGVAALVAANPAVKVLIAPVPDMVYLAHLGAAHSCQGTWSRFKICPRLLGRGVSDLQQQRFGEQLRDVNDALRSIAEAYPANARFAEAVATAQFEWQHVSHIDCFHPSVEGQSVLAGLAWQDGWLTGPGAP